ncbi:MAG: hypothetical protein ACJ8F7_21710 [Gemmataceae bacterium]
MARIVAPALRALLEHIIDYAGAFPPAALPHPVACANFQDYRHGPHAWMLRWLVIGSADIAVLPPSLHGAVALLGDADDPRAAAIETKRVVPATRPAYCEAPVEALDDVRRAGHFAKLRTGGVKPDAIPPVEAVAAFIRACAQRRLPFKATAGLHHPVRAMHPLTYEPDAPRAVMHGFLNVFVAAAFAWHGQPAIEPVLADFDPTAFRFDGRAHWRDWSLDAVQVREARTEFAHAFGSCSFEEPVRDLEALGLL